MSDGALQRIGDLIASNEVLLFIKGTPLFPQCGFSSKAVAILERLGTPLLIHQLYFCTCQLAVGAQQLVTAFFGGHAGLRQILAAIALQLGEGAAMSARWNGNAGDDFSLSQRRATGS